MKYSDAYWQKITLFTTSHGKIEGLVWDGRIGLDTIPKEYNYYWLRHSDIDWGDIASVSNSAILVNFYGMLLTKDPLPFKGNSEEWEVEDWAIKID